MPDLQPLILGEYRCRLDSRYRVPIPAELSGPLTADSPGFVLAKERPGCISLWNGVVWESKVNARINLARQKIEQGFQDDKIAQVQLFGRLLSTRHDNATLDSHGRLTVPKSFRDFLGVEPRKPGRTKQGEADDVEPTKAEPRGDVMVVGAAVCVEIWRPASWLKHLEQRMPKFRRLVERLY